MSTIAQLRQAIPHLADYTDQEIANVVATVQGATPGTSQFRKYTADALGYDRTMGDAVKDAGVALVQNSMGLAKFASSAVAAAIPGVSAYDNPVTNYLNEGSDAVGMVYKSKGLKNREAGTAIAEEIARRDAAANGSGTMGQIAAGFGATAKSYSVPQAIQAGLSSAGTFVGPAVAGRGLQIAGGALGLGESAAIKAGTAGGVGTAAVMQGLDIGTDTYQSMIKAGASPEVARTAARRATAMAGAATVATSMLPGGRTIERSLLTGVTTKAGVNGLARRGLGAVGEGFTEALEEGAGKLASNYEVGGYDGKTPLASGVGAAAFEGMVAAGPMGALAAHGHTPMARTAEGEIDLTGTSVGPGPYDAPAYARRGLDPLNERSSPIPNPAQAAARQQAQTGRGTIMVDANGTALPAQSPEQMARLEEIRRFNDGIPTLTDVLAPADGIPVLTDVVKNPKQPTKGDVMAALAKANTAVAGTAVRKDGKIAATKAAAPLRQVLESKDPAGTIRSLYEDGAAPRDELLDNWHRELTGKTVSEHNAAEQSNSAGFVAEPAEQVAAQLDAVREGRKDVAVLGQEEAKTANLEGLHTAVATDSTGASAVVASADPQKVEAAVARAPEVGLKQAMGEALGYANPSLTTEAAPDAAVVQHIDDATGQIINEQLATPTDAANIAPVNGATARVVPVEKAIGDRQGKPAWNAKALAKEAKLQEQLRVANENSAARKAKPEQGVKLGKKTIDEVIDLAETAKDDQAYKSARYELYKRWSDHGDAKAEAYLTDKANKSDMKKAEKEGFERQYQEELKARAVKKSAKMAAKFGQDEGGDIKLGRSIFDSMPNPDNGTGQLTGNDVADIKDGKQAIDWLRNNAENPWHRTIANKIAPFLKNVSVKFVTEGDSVPSLVARHLNGEAAAVAHLTEGKYNLYFRLDKSFNQTTLLHELIHAATMQALSGQHNIALRNEMRALIKQIKSEFSNIEYNSAVDEKTRKTAAFMDNVLTDENELLAYAFSSPTMRKWMENMTAAGKFVTHDKTAAALRDRAERRMPGVPPLTMWQRFTDAIRKLFGLAPVNQRAFEQLMADRANTISGIVEAGKDTTLYSRLDDMLQRSLDAQAAMAFGDVTGVAASRDSVMNNGARASAQQTEADVRAMVKGKEISSKVLSVLTLRQIAEQYGKKLPALTHWIDAIMSRGAKASDLAARADRIAMAWESTVPKADRKPLADVLLRASDAEVELDNTDPKYLADLTTKQRAEYDSLRKKLAALSPEAQKIRKDVIKTLRDQWQYTRDSLETFINQTVADPQMRDQRIADLKHEMGRNRGDYFPFSRFGDRIVIAKGAASDGRDVVSFHESEAAANAAVVNHYKAGVKNVVATLKSDFDKQARASTGFVGQIHQLIDASGAEGTAKQELHDALQSIFLRSMPELSGAKSMIRRENVEGFSRDALRVFADAVTRGARYASHLEFAPTISAAKEEAEQQTRSSDKRLASIVIGRKEGAAPKVMIVPAGTDRLNAVNQMREQGYAAEFVNAMPETAEERLRGSLENVTDDEIKGYLAKLTEVVGRSGMQIEDMRAAKALYNHMVALQNRETTPSALVDAAGQLGHFWYLGLSPSQWATNLLQNPAVGMPILGAKYGMARATAEWLGTARWFTGVRMGKLFTDRTAQFSVEWMAQEVAEGRLKGISKDELSMLQALQDHRALDFTQAMDLNRISQAGAESPASHARYKALRFAAAGAHHTEVFNRVTFALAAYRLALKSSSDVTHEEAVRRAENDTFTAHFDYSPENAPMLMRGNLSRLVFMFQKYRQHQLYWWAKNVKQAVQNEEPGDRKKALQAALLMGTTQLALGGVRALPFVGAVAFLANLFAGDDDDGVPFDFNDWINTAAKDTMGDAAGEVFAQGIFGLMGMNIATRIGQGGILLNEGSEKYERNADDKTRAYLFDLAGPMGSMALGVAKAYEKAQQGDLVGAAAATTPKVVADALKGYQLAHEGLVDHKKGLTIADSDRFDASDVMMQSLGVTPRELSELKADRAKVRNIDQALKDKSHHLTNAYVQAWQQDDKEGMGEAIEKINEFNGKVPAHFRSPAIIISGQSIKMAVLQFQSQQRMLALTSGSASNMRQMMIANQSTLKTPVTPATVQQKKAELDSRR